MWIRLQSRQKLMLLIVWCVLISSPLVVNAQNAGVIVEPQNGAEFFGRKPELLVKFKKNILPPNTILIFDGMDVTSASKFTKSSITYKSPIPVSAGMHSVTVMGYYEDTSQFRRDWSFNVKHSQKFEEISANANVTLSYSHNVKKKPDTLGNWVFQGSGPVRFTLKDKGKEMALNGNLFYIDQEKTQQSAIAEEGLDFRSFLLSGKYASEKLKTEINVGDVSIKQTYYTAPNIYRRGAQVKLDTTVGAFSAFTVNASQVVGVRNGLEIGFDTDENILGASMNKTTKNGKTTFNLAYLNGREISGSTTTASSPDVVSEGDVLGANVQQLLIPGKLAISVEGAYSHFDRDVTLENGKNSGWAANTGLNWQATDKLNLQLVLEHIDKHFHSIGATGLASDIENINFTANLALNKHNLSFNVYNGWSDLDNDPNVPGATQRQITVNDNWRIKDHISLMLSAFGDFVKSKDEPAGINPTDRTTLGMNGTLGYQKPKWALQTLLALSDTEDDTPANMDTSQQQLRLNLSWFPSPRANLNLMFPQWIRDDNKNSDVSTDSFAASLALNTWPIKEKLSFDLNQFYTSSEASDNSRDDTNLTTSARLAYNLKKYFPDYARPTLALGYEYNRTQNKAMNLDQTQYRIMLTLEVNANRSY